jgi:hypothetical protein
MFVLAKAAAEGPGKDSPEDIAFYEEAKIRFGLAPRPKPPPGDGPAAPEPRAGPTPEPPARTHDPDAPRPPNRLVHAARQPAVPRRLAAGLPPALPNRKSGSWMSS